MNLSKPPSIIFKLSAEISVFVIDGELKNEDETTSPNQLIGLLNKTSLKFDTFTMTNKLGQFKLATKNIRPAIIMAFDRTGGFMPAVIDEVEPSIKTYQPAG